jgi:hypothetical protein
LSGVIVALVGAALGGLLPLSGSRVLNGRSWTGTVTDDGVSSVAAHASVLSERGSVASGWH